MIEKFLVLLSALVASIEANTAAQLKLAAAVSATPAPTGEAKETKKGGKAATETKAETKAETKNETPALTVADVRAAAQALLDANGNDGGALTELNKKYGTKRISEVPADKYNEVVAALKTLTDAAKASANSGI